jgi:hypothetical protein
MRDSDVEKTVESNPALSALSVPAGTYPSLDNAVATFGPSATLVASDNLDEETAYTIIEALMTNSDRVSRAHPALASFSPDALKIGETGIPMHPGASKYMSEHQ